MNFKKHSIVIGNGCCGDFIFPLPYQIGDKRSRMIVAVQTTCDILKNEKRPNDFEFTRVNVPIKYTINVKMINGKGGEILSLPSASLMKNGQAINCQDGNWYEIKLVFNLLCFNQRRMRRIRENFTVITRDYLGMIYQIELPANLCVSFLGICVIYIF